MMEPVSFRYLVQENQEKLHQLVAKKKNKKNLK